MSRLDQQEWCQAVEDPESLSTAAWSRLEAALGADAALRQRLVAERQLHEQLSRLHDAGRGDLGAVLAHRLAHAADHPRFVRRVLRRSSRRRMPVMALAVAALVTVTLALAWRTRQPAAEAHWVNGPASLALDGGGSAELEPGARWRDGAEPFLERGGARLEVSPRTGAPFRLRTPQALITVLGTRFTIQVESDTAVSVQHGHVRLEGSAGPPVELMTGARGRCGDGPVQTERILFASSFMTGEPMHILIGSASPHDPQERADPCVAAGVYVTESGPRVAATISVPQTGFVRYEPGLLMHFRWWAEPAVGTVRLLVWNIDQDRNYAIDLGQADGTWQQASLPFARLQPLPGLPQPDLRSQPGDRLQGVLVIGNATSGRLFVDDLTFSVPE